MKKEFPEWIQKLLGKKFKKEQMIVLFLIGILLFICSLPTEKKEKDTAENTKITETEGSGSVEEYCNHIENRLENILSDIDGAGETKVMITLKDFGEEIVEKDIKKEESNYHAGEEAKTQTLSEEETIYGKDESGGEEPYISKRIQPDIAGVLIICEGGDDVNVKKNISEAVLALFDVEIHKIKIEKMKLKGEK